MKKYIVLALLLSVVTLLSAKAPRRSTRSLVEIGPKASLYIYEHFDLGIGAEVVCNPLRNVGIRLNVTELRFGHSTSFDLNYQSSLDGLIYIPMSGIEPYVHFGAGFLFLDNPSPADNSTFLSLRFGMGFLWPIQPRTNLFLEPGVLINANGGTDAIFRLSFGGRFGVL